MKVYLKNLTGRILKTLFVTGGAVIFLFGASCERPEEKTIEDVILNDKESYFYIDFDDYPEERAPLPIGVFDSGTGGLAVLNDIIDYYPEENEDSRLFENESFIYLADMANMPYGSYALEDNTELLQEHIIKNVQFLLDEKYYLEADDQDYITGKDPVKAIVIACNTATAYGQEEIEEFLEKAGMDDMIVKGVIDAATTGAINEFSDHEDGTVAVMATDGTVRSGAYVTSLEEKKDELGREGDIGIFQQAAIGIAEAVDENSDFIDRSATEPREGYMGPSEEGDPPLFINLDILDRYHFDMEDNAMLFDGTPENPENIQINSVENYVAFHLVSLMEKIKNSEDPQPLKSIILGCTHYPYVEDVFVEVLDKLRNYIEEGQYVYRPYMEDEITLVNPAVKIADQLHKRLEERELLTDENNYMDSEFFIAVPNILNENLELREDGSFTYEYKYGRTAGEIQEYVKRVPFSRRAIPDDILERLAEQISSTYEIMVRFNEENPKTEHLTEEEKIKLPE